jgi:hypothetical protein
MRLALQEAVRAHWTDKIHGEWMRNVQADYPDTTWEDLRRIRGLMEKALPAASIHWHWAFRWTLSTIATGEGHVSG